MFVYLGLLLLFWYASFSLSIIRENFKYLIVYISFICNIDLNILRIKRRRIRCFLILSNAFLRMSDYTTILLITVGKKQNIFDIHYKISSSPSKLVDAENNFLHIGVNMCLSNNRYIYFDYWIFPCSSVTV